MTLADRRKVSYKEHDQKGCTGYCLCITGGMYDPPIGIVEREDGTLTKIPIEDIQFIDIPLWASAEEQ